LVVALVANGLRWCDGRRYASAALQTRTQFCERRPLGHLANLVQQIVGKRHTRQRCPRFEPTKLLFPELMAELDAIKSRTLSGLMSRRDRKDREGGRTAAVDHGQGKTRPSPGNRQGDRPSRQVGDDLSFASFRHGRFAEAADADLTDAQLRVAARPRRR